MEECCALCNRKAAMQCDSDQAKLCWNCDERVHSANFLVAMHSRVLLCSLCHSSTMWKASGPKLAPTFSLCHNCLADRRANRQRAALDDRIHDCDYVDDDGEYSSDLDDEDNDDEGGNNGNGEEEEEEEVDEDEEGENQVVPMSYASATSPPPGDAGLSLKRMRDGSFSVDSRGETGSSSSEMGSAALPSSDESTSMSVFGSLKGTKICCLKK